MPLGDWKGRPAACLANEFAPTEKVPGLSAGTYSPSPFRERVGVRGFCRLGRAQRSPTRWVVMSRVGLRVPLPQPTGRPAACLANEFAPTEKVPGLSAGTYSPSPFRERVGVRGFCRLGRTQRSPTRWVVMSRVGLRVPLPQPTGRAAACLAIEIAPTESNPAAEPSSILLLHRLVVAGKLLLNILGCGVVVAEDHAEGAMALGDRLEASGVAVQFCQRHLAVDQCQPLGQ